MIRLNVAARLVAGTLALGVNVALAGGLAALANHYGEQAAQSFALGAPARAAGHAQASTVRCAPQQSRSG